MNKVIYQFTYAVVHRDLSLAGKDIKVAIYDDMVEITSPGLLPPSIDYSAMENRQSDARNKIIAPVFKRLGIIDQWGNGLKLIADEIGEYPEIEMRWKEVGLSFQVQFVKKNYGDNVGDVGDNVGDVGDLESRLLNLIRQSKDSSTKDIAKALSISKRHCERLIAELKRKGRLSRVGNSKSGYWQVIK